MDLSKLITVDQVAEVILMKPATIRCWLREGKLKGSKLPGGDWRIKEQDLAAILQP